MPKTLKEILKEALIGKTFKSRQLEVIYKVKDINVENSKTFLVVEYQNKNKTEVFFNLELPINDLELEPKKEEVKKGVGYSGMGF